MERCLHTASSHCLLPSQLLLDTPCRKESQQSMWREIIRRFAVSSWATQPWAPVSVQVPWCDLAFPCREQAEWPQCPLVPDKRSQFGEVGTCRTKRDSTWSVGRETALELELILKNLAVKYRTTVFVNSAY